MKYYLHGDMAYMATGDEHKIDPADTELTEAQYNAIKNPPPTPDELQAAFSADVTDKLTAFVQARGWDALDRVLAQRGAFAEDAATVQAAYDDTWAAALALLPEVRSGELSIEAALEQLPALGWADA